MKGIILAAGKGTRLYPITKHIPKPLLPIAGKPTIHYAFERLKEINVQEICLVVGENETEMKRAIGDGSSQGVSIHYVKQTEPKGLAHAMSFAKDFIGSSDFIMYLGDAIYSQTLEPIQQVFEETNCVNLNLVKAVEDPSRFGVAEVQNGRITKLVEKPKQPKSNLAMAGVYFFKNRIWDTLEQLQPSQRGEYEITDAIQMLVAWGEDVRAAEYEGEWFDTGTLDSYLQCSAFLLKHQSVIEQGAMVNANIGPSVWIGQNAIVECTHIEDAAIMPHSHVQINGHITHAILAETVQSQNPIQSEIRYGTETE